ncbi:class I SAM-dependent methyltransferase [Corynebacterium pacaense]|uniref:class I SAM-dependent methyltransferase n=1 Tax=Corynebacterium pacaense TaxID=1816684 RepID=UPI0009BAED22|nr:class I SAM-dependent methyltransferase [Corynebacterium pacaense]
MAYWNHNTAYHPWILRHLHRGARLLDVGCGDGLLLQRAAHLGCVTTGIEPDPSAYNRALRRLHGNAALHNCTLDDLDAPDASFDAITFVASLHHMDTTAALSSARRLLCPDGILLVVGLTANKSFSDWGVSALQLPVVATLGRLHGETPDIGVPVQSPRESYSEIAALTRKILPGRRLGRGLYYRFLMEWRNVLHRAPPSGAAAP